MTTSTKKLSSIILVHYDESHKPAGKFCEHGRSALRFRFGDKWCRLAIQGSPSKNQVAGELRRLAACMERLKK